MPVDHFIAKWLWKININENVHCVNLFTVNLTATKYNAIVFINLCEYIVKIYALIMMVIHFHCINV